MAWTNLGMSPNNVMEKARAFLAGTVKEIPGGAAIRVNGAQLTGEQIRAKLERVVELCRAVNQARAEEQRALAALRKETPGLKQFFANFKAALGVHFGPLSAKLASFGLSPRKTPRRRTAMEKLLSAHRRAATRAANRAAQAAAGTNGASAPASPAAS